MAVGRARLDRRAFDDLINTHIDAVHDRAVDLEARYMAPMLQAVQLLAGAGHEMRVWPAARIWAMRQSGEELAPTALRREANVALDDLPVAAFPAVAHAALGSPTEPETLKRLRLVGAALLGRI